MKPTTRLSLRTDLFDHGLYPSSKFASQPLINLFSNLHLVSSIEYRIWQKDFLDQAPKFFTGLCPQDCAIYWTTFKALVDDDSSDPHQADVRCFAVYICLQSYQQSIQETSRTQLTKETWQQD